MEKNIYKFLLQKKRKESLMNTLKRIKSILARKLVCLDLWCII